MEVVIVFSILRCQWLAAQLPLIFPLLTLISAFRNKSDSARSVSELVCAVKGKA